jgi:Na+-driven multidrug efflux pump
MKQFWPNLAVAVFLLLALVYSISVGPFYERATMVGTPSVQRWADALFRLTIGGLALTFFLRALSGWLIRPAWGKVGMYLAGLATIVCALGFLLLMHGFHLGPKPS